MKRTYSKIAVPLLALGVAVVQCVQRSAPSEAPSVQENNSVNSQTEDFRSVFGKIVEKKPKEEDLPALQPLYDESGVLKGMETLINCLETQGNLVCLRGDGVYTSASCFSRESGVRSPTVLLKEIKAEESFLPIDQHSLQVTFRSEGLEGPNNYNLDDKNRQAGIESAQKACHDILEKVKEETDTFECKPEEEEDCELIEWLVAPGPMINKEAVQLDQLLSENGFDYELVNSTSFTVYMEGGESLKITMNRNITNVCSYENGENPSCRWTYQWIVDQPSIHWPSSYFSTAEEVLEMLYMSDCTQPLGCLPVLSAPMD